ncbi:hypothetical protein RIF29_38309 [Crotalaria pallida]|uniref:Uncharacterized protein n=1 Tax=Crotalaria pallida TaxID=3830 RepID=A0AAN9HLE3_CROPI
MASSFKCEKGFEWTSLANIYISLAKISRLKESDSALQSLREKNADVHHEAAEIKDYTKALQRKTEASIIGLFQVQYMKALIVGVGLMSLHARLVDTVRSDECLSSYSKKVLPEEINFLLRKPLVITTIHKPQD